MHVTLKSEQKILGGKKSVLSSIITHLIFLALITFYLPLCSSLSDSSSTAIAFFFFVFLYVLFFELGFTRLSDPRIIHVGTKGDVR